jgi:hypothetical protein
VGYFKRMVDGENRVKRGEVKSEVLTSLRKHESEVLVGIDKSMSAVAQGQRPSPPLQSDDLAAMEGSTTVSRAGYKYVKPEGAPGTMGDAGAGAPEHMAADGGAATHGDAGATAHDGGAAEAADSGAPSPMATDAGSAPSPSPSGAPKDPR